MLLMLFLPPAIAVAVAHRHTGMQAHRHTGTQAHRLTGTQAHRHTGTQAHGHTGTQAHRHPLPSLMAMMATGCHH